MFHRMIRVFECPKGRLGKGIARLMDISNDGMHKALVRGIDGNAGSILEIGYGNGKTIKLLREKAPGARIFGMDLSRDMYESAMDTVGSDPNCFLSTGDCAELDYDDNAFDYVITTDTCYFWSLPDKVMAEISRVLKPGGMFGNAYNGTYAAFIRADRKDEKLYTDKRIVDAAKKHGLMLKGAGKQGLTGHVLWFKKE